jgi:hypothetical protein
LAQVQQIKPVWFRYNGKAGIVSRQRYVGVIAQQMQQIAPYTIGEFVYQDSSGRTEKYLDYDANALTYMLVNAVREVDQKYARQLHEKDAQLISQQQQIASLTERLTRLEAFLSPGPAAATAQLYQNEPNPTDGSTLIRYFLPQETVSAQLKVYSLTGQEAALRGIDAQRQWRSAPVGGTICCR